MHSIPTSLPADVVGEAPSPMRDALGDLLGSSDFQSLDATFGLFCPFEALGMVRAEIRHGNFLAYIINPRRPHGLGSRVLHAFLDLVDAASVGAGSLEPDTVDVRREWRNIDLVVVIPSLRTVCAVELKIDASQGHDQLARYRKVVEAEWPGWRHHFVFLAKNDETAKDGWSELRLAPLIAALDRVADAAPEAPASPTLKQYCAMTRRHHVDDPATIELARRLWAEHGQALSFLMRQRREQPLQFLIDAISDRADELAEAASLPGLRIVTDEHQDDIVRFAVEHWDALPGFLDGVGWTASGRVMLIEIKLRRDHISAYIYTGPTTTPALRDTLASSLTAAGVTRKKVSASNRHVALAEMTLFEIENPLDIDEDAAIDGVAAGFRAFVADTVTRFNDAFRSGLVNIHMLAGSK